MESVERELGEIHVKLDHITDTLDDQVKFIRSIEKRVRGLERFKALAKGGAFTISALLAAGAGWLKLLKGGGA